MRLFPYVHKDVHQAVVRALQVAQDDAEVAREQYNELFQQFLLMRNNKTLDEISKYAREVFSEHVSVLEDLQSVIGEWLDREVDK